MQILRSFGLLSILLISAATIAAETPPANDGEKAAPTAKSKSQQLVEDVDIQGNRRLKDQDLLYYIKTRKGDTYNPKQVQSDLKELLSFNWFDKTESRVITEQGIRGGVNVIFEVKELPIIRDLQFEGTKAIQESDILKAFRENRVGISKESIYDPVNSRKARRVLREMLASKGYPNAKIEVREEIVSATSVAITFDIEQGNRSRIVKIDFEGNNNFKDGELRKQLQLVKESGLLSRFKGQDILDLRKLEYDLQKNVLEHIRSKGYFQARIGDPQVVGLGYKRTGIPVLGILPLPLISSKDDTLKVVVPIVEGRVFRVGEVKIEGNSIFSEQQISGIIGVKKGEIADGKRLREALYEDLKKIYGSQGFVEYDVELVPDLKDNPDNPEEGIVDINVNIDEGKQYRLRRLEFVGNTFTRDRVLRREILINEGDIYNQSRLEISVARLNQLGYFDPIDKDKDLEIRTDSDQGFVDSIVKVSERGRQQISFNGGVSGIGGSFFGLEYSTNNLLGRGNTVSFAFAAGNRQQSFQLSYQEPYFRDRPIAVGFSLFAARSKFFGEGTFLSQNIDAIGGAIDPFGTVRTDEENLFTRDTYGGTFFATAPLSEFLFKKRRFTSFARIGLTYQFSATTIKDPEVNQSTDISQRIPIIFAQPNIITSRVTPTFVYDTRQPAANGIDTASGTQISASFAFAGLGGDVRTYKPQISFSQFIPVRRKKSKSAEVFAYRIQASTTGSFSISDKIRNANSVAFVNGVPIFEREFLGSEFDLRGYNVRSIGPIAPYNTFITTQNVQLASNVIGEPELMRVVSDGNGGTTTEPLVIPQAVSDLVTPLATYTGADGANPLLFQRTFQPIGGDTKLLGNFEYRIPLFGPATLAAFADIGTVFNLRKGGIQNIRSNFLRDDLFIGSGTLTLTSLLQNEEYERSFGAFLFDGNQVLTATQFENTYCGGVRADCPVTLPDGVQPLFLRGDAQTTGQLDVGESVFGRFNDIRSSIGLEMRVQVPVVNVPFRLIYYYNPNAKLGFTEELPGLFLRGKKSGFRFTVGRTF
ncbi:MAG: outer membrane protein assembly factor BamA [Pyrinomonadaceae bacterium]|nr:outer membrane protein assembly factor BamA [Pyrinomonadaceae bacterium]